MPTPRRRAVLLGPLVAGSAATAQPPWSPDRPIRFFQGFAPGGGTDILARLLAPHLAASLGQPVVVENRPGAGGTLAAEALARARPDGQTMILLNNAHAASTAVFRRLPYDPVEDIVPATVVATMGLVLVVPPGGPHATLAGLLRAARERPGALNLGTVGVGGTQHFAAEALAAMAGVRFTHIPYRGTPDALIALRNGQVQLVVETLGAVIGQLRGGEARALAVTTAARDAALPDVPTIAEAAPLPGFERATWYAIGFPAGTPPAVLARLHQATAQALGDAALRSRLADLGLTPVGSTPDEARATILTEIARARETAARAGIPQQ